MLYTKGLCVGLVLGVIMPVHAQTGVSGTCAKPATDITSPMLGVRSLVRTRAMSGLDSIVAYARKHQLPSAALEKLYDSVKNGVQYPEIEIVRMAFDEINQAITSIGLKTRGYSKFLDGVFKRGLMTGEDQKIVYKRTIDRLLVHLPVIDDKFDVITRSPRPQSGVLTSAASAGAVGAAYQHLAVTQGTHLSGDVIISNYSMPAQDGAANQVLKTDGAGHVTFNSVSGTGDVVGPNSATDNAIARFDGVTGKAIQNSAATINDSGAIAASSLTVTGDVTAGGLVVTGGALVNSTSGAGDTNIGNASNVIHLVASTGANGVSIQGTFQANATSLDGNTTIGNEFDTVQITGTDITLDGSGEWSFLGDYAPYVSLKDDGPSYERGAQLGCDDGLIESKVQSLPGALYINSGDLAAGSTVQIGRDNIHSRVGIGAAPDSTKILKVTGATEITGAVNANSTLSVGGSELSGKTFYVTGLAGGTSEWNAPSDGRIKKAVTPLDEMVVLEAVNQLKPVAFTYTDEWQKAGHVDASRQIGFIAQDVEQVFPEAVRRGPSQFSAVDGTMYSLESARLIPALVCSCQALSKQLASAQNRLSELDALKSRLAALEKGSLVTEIK